MLSFFLYFTSSILPFISKLMIYLKYTEISHIRLTQKQKHKSKVNLTFFSTNCSVIDLTIYFIIVLNANKFMTTHMYVRMYIIHFLETITIKRITIFSSLFLGRKNKRSIEYSDKIIFFLLSPKLVIPRIFYTWNMVLCLKIWTQSLHSFGNSI